MRILFILTEFGLEKDINMIDVVIIAQNEGKHIENMFACIPQDWHIVYVADRCTDKTQDKLRKERLKFGDRLTTVENSKGEGRRTSDMRNLGFRFTRPKSDVLFLDGDRYVVNGSLIYLQKWHKDVALLKLEEDGRELIDDYSKVYGSVHNAFYSCGLFIKRDAIEKIRQFQCGAIFRPDMQAMWGIEDCYLGDVCYHLGLSCGFYEDCRLRGRFEKFRLDSLYAIEKRLFERDKLNVRWD